MRVPFRVLFTKVPHFWGDLKRDHSVEKTTLLLQLQFWSSRGGRRQLAPITFSGFRVQILASLTRPSFRNGWQLLLLLLPMLLLLLLALVPAPTLACAAATVTTLATSSAAAATTINTIPAGSTGIATSSEAHDRISYEMSYQTVVSYVIRQHFSTRWVFPVRQRFSYYTAAFKDAFSN